MAHRPFLLSGIIGIGVIILSLVLVKTEPRHTGDLAEGFFTPIVAFEFAESAQDVNLIFLDRSSQIITGAVEAVTFGTYLDFIFMTLYGLFLVTFSLICVALTKKSFYYWAAVLAVLALLFDLIENLQLLKIMDQLGTGSMVGELRYLHLFTWLKWGALALIFLMLIPFFRKSGAFGRVLAVLAPIPLVLGFLAYFVPGLLNELFALSISVMFLLTILFSFIHTRERVDVSTL